MLFTETSLPGAYVIDLEKRVDERGHFARAWCRREFEALGLASEIEQINVAFSPRRGTLRGLHFQRPPHEEVKLVRCTRGAIFDVIVDLRPESPTHLRWFAAELTADNGRMLYMPRGFAHGYQTLEDGTEITYQTTHPYVPHAASGVRFDDPALGIRWPLLVTAVSAADHSWPLLSFVGQASSLPGNVAQASSLSNCALPFSDSSPPNGRLVACPAAVNS